MKKYLFIATGAAVIAALLIYLAGIGAAYIFSPAIYHPPQAEYTVTMPIQPGETVTCTVPVTLPADMRIAHAEISGTSVIPLTAAISSGKYLWNRRVWHITGKFRILKEGKTGDLALECALRQIFSSRISKTLRIPLPEISSALAPSLLPGSELTLAGEITPPRQRNSILSWHWLWLLLPLLAGAIYGAWHKFFRRIILPKPWEKALHAVTKLCNRVKHKKISPEKAFAALCDVVRDYLEIRFAIPAPRLTTQEFMQNMLNFSSPVTEEQRNFLCRFLATADMIKFARAASDDTAFNLAAEHAAELIRATAEEENGK